MQRGDQTPHLMVPSRPMEFMRRRIVECGGEHHATPGCRSFAVSAPNNTSSTYSSSALHLLRPPPTHPYTSIPACYYLPPPSSRTATLTQHYHPDSNHYPQVRRPIRCNQYSNVLNITYIAALGRGAMSRSLPQDLRYQNKLLFYLLQFLRE